MPVCVCVWGRESGCSAKWCLPNFQRENGNVVHLKSFIYVILMCISRSGRMKARWERLDLSLSFSSSSDGNFNSAAAPLTQGWTPPGGGGGGLVTCRLLLRSRPSRVNPATLTFCLTHDDMLYISTDPTYTRSITCITHTAPYAFPCLVQCCPMHVNDYNLCCYGFKGIDEISIHFFY